MDTVFFTHKLYLRVSVLLRMSLRAIPLGEGRAKQSDLLWQQGQSDCFVPIKNIGTRKDTGGSVRSQTEFGNVARTDRLPRFVNALQVFLRRAVSQSGRADHHFFRLLFIALVEIYHPEIIPGVGVFGIKRYRLLK
jgi:hypothetical protein